MSRGNSSIKGLTFRGRIEEFTENNKVELEFATLSRKGSNKMALDTAPMGVYNVDSDVAEAGSTNYKIIATGHLAKKGDKVRFLATAGAIDELEVDVKEVTANEIVLDGVLSAAVQAGDTFDILRPVSPRYDSTGASLASVISPPIEINVDTGSGPTPTTVLDDRVTPANSVPIPVRLYGVTGNINITSEDLNVQLSHSAASPDSVQIGDGTEIALINASGELQVRDDDLNTDFDTLLTSLDGGARQQRVDIIGTGGIALDTTSQAIRDRLPASLGEKAEAASLAVTLSTENELILSNIQTSVQLIDNAMGSVGTDELRVDLIDLGGAATDATLSTMSQKLPASLGQKIESNSLSVTLSTENEDKLDRIMDSVELLDNALGTIGTDELRINIVGQGGLATETTLDNIHDKLPTALGQQNKAGSLSVTIASDQEALNTNAAVVDFLDGGVVDTSSTNITVGAGPNLVASLAANVKKIQIIEDIGEFMSLKDGGGTVLAYLPLGGGEVEVSIASGTAIHIASETGGTINIGKIAINFLG